jgi:hypothetical protein
VRGSPDRCSSLDAKRPVIQRQLGMWDSCCSKRKEITSD